MSSYLLPDATILQTLQAGMRQQRLDWGRPVQQTLAAVDLEPAVLPSLWSALNWWGPLDEALRDDQTHDIYINGPEREVLIGQHGQIVPLGMRLHREWIEWLQRKLHVNRALHAVDGAMAATGVAVARGVRKIRYAMTQDRTTPDGPTLTLRLLPDVWPGLDELVVQGLLPHEAAELLLRAMHSDVTVLISGGTGTGKTTLAAALKLAVPQQRAVVVQDAPELPTGDPCNDIGYVVDDGDISAFLGCVRHALRQQPQRIIIGEGRGPELLAMIEGAGTGHPGLTTIHAASAQDALLRLETYACSAPNVTQLIVRANLTRLAMLVIHIGRIDDGRRITQISELRPGSELSPGAPFECGTIWAIANGILTRTDDPVRGAWAQEVLHEY